MVIRQIEDFKIKEIANAIRAKIGKAEEMTLDQMPSLIESIMTGSDGSPRVVKTAVNIVVDTSITAGKYYSHMLYNGVRLPRIPIDVLDRYPYAFIKYTASDDSYSLYLAELPWWYNTTYDALDVAVGYYREYYVISGDSWVKDSTIGTVVRIDSDRTVLWSNHDIPYGSATATDIYFAGSEPILTD